MPENDQLISLLIERSYREGDFVLASGAKSSFYLDAKQVTYHPDGARIVGEQVHALARARGLRSVGGLTMGADAIIASTVYASGLHGHPMTGFVVRKEAKQHGLGKWIEGVSPDGLDVVMVDDVITSGMSVLKAADRAIEAGARVRLVVGVVDREQGGGAAIEERGIEFAALATISQIRERVRQGR
jgi:orotate phosphoribosyltransferase